MVDDSQIAQLVAERKAFPCYFGSALKLDGVDALLDGLERYLPAPQYGADFGARVFKIARDAQATACHISKSPAVRCPCVSSFRAARTAAGRKK